jgi:hypothetical protein
LIQIKLKHLFVHSVDDQAEKSTALWGD